MEDRVRPEGRCNKATDERKMVYGLKMRIGTELSRKTPLSCLLIVLSTVVLGPYELRATSSSMVRRQAFEMIRNKRWQARYWDRCMLTCLHFSFMVAYLIY